MYKYLIFFFIIIFTSCVSLGYDPHNKPIPEQSGKSFSIKQSERTLISIPLYTIEKPKNHEAGWDEDDVILVYRSSLIKPEFSSRWGWSSDSGWTIFRLDCKPPFGYGGKFAARISDGEIRIICGSRGQFLVDLHSIYLTYDHYN